MKKNIKENKTLSNLIMIVCGILCIILLPILIFNSILIINSFINKKEIPSIGNTIPLIVLSDSMYPEIKNGDLIFLKKTSVEDIKKNDIVTYFDSKISKTNTTTHRVVNIVEDRENKTLSFQTKGDSNDSVDSVLVPSENIVGIYQGKISNVGHVLIFLSTTQGLIISIVLPLIILISYDLIKRKKYEKEIEIKRKQLLEELNELKKEAKRMKE